MDCNFENYWGKCKHHVTSLNNDGKKITHHVVDKKVRIGSFEHVWVRQFEMA